MKLKSAGTGRIKRNLVFITNYFPFGYGEVFIEPEFRYLKDNFEKIIIISQDVDGPRTRPVPDHIILRRHNPVSGLIDYLKLPLLIIFNSLNILRLIKAEFEFRNKTGERISPGKFRWLLKRIIKALQLKSFIVRALHSENIKENIVFYSYWLKTGAHAISLLKYPGSIKISRAHRIDLREEETDQKYLPLLKTCADNLDAIFFISENGKRYLTKKFGYDSPKFRLSYLGVENSFKPGLSGQTDNFVIVSCSSLVPVKRIDLIINSLALIKTGKRIDWLHFGDGTLKDDLVALAGKCLSNTRISYEFMGFYPNKKLLEFYNTTRVDLFLNTSITEGIPVSIMEAQSAGIPVIATNVGGVSEIVVDGTGYLIAPDIKPEQLAGLISAYINLPQTEISKLRSKAFQNWKANYNAEKNYRKFIECINVIFASKSSDSGY